MAAPYYTYRTNLLDREKYTSTVETSFPDVYGSNIRRYFSSIDTEVYFGDLLIDEMVAFDFMIDEKKMPIYGYNTFVPKRMIIGQKTIQGSFAINFTHTFNMQYILESIEDSLYANAYEEAQFYCSEDNAALYGKGFDITLSYGDHKGKQSYNSCSQTLVGCYITSYRQAFDTSGEPILDMYTFIAKDLIVQDFGTAEASTFTLGRERSGSITNKETNMPDDWRYAYANNSTDRTSLVEYCKVNTNTAGFIVNPQYIYNSGKHTISLKVETLNIKNSDIIEASIRIDDKTALDGKSDTSRTLNSKDKKTFSVVLSGDELWIGKKISEKLSNGTIKNVACSINIKYKNSNGEEQDTNYTTIMSYEITNN